MKRHPQLSNLRAEFNKVPEKLNEHLENIGAPHVNSFNDFLKHGLDSISKHMLPARMQSPAGERIEIKIHSLYIDKPEVPIEVIGVKDRLEYPAEVRMLKKSYVGTCRVRIAWKVDDLEKGHIDADLGKVPIMTRSDACNLNNLNPKEMIKRHEHETDWGGIFVVKGNERLLRMLQITRRNYPIALRRNNWKARGQNFSDLGVLVRSVRDDEASLTNVLHYLNDGTIKLHFSQIKSMNFIPVCLILKCLMNYTDNEIFERLKRGYENDHYYLACVKNMLTVVHTEGLHTSEHCRNYLGQIFRSKFYELPEWSTSFDIIDFILNERILIHLKSHKDKFDLLIFMIQKLFQCAQNRHKLENPDAIMAHELFVPGILYQKIFGECINMWLSQVKKILLKKLESPDTLVTSAILNQCIRSAGSIGRRLESFIATGNAPARGIAGLVQNSGLSVVAENINRIRYMSHFRSIHRGSFFTQMRTTEARKLLPDAWGFVCPVHTPDGTPCGILNHLAITCKISVIPDTKLVEEIPKHLIRLGMIPLDSDIFETDTKSFVVFIDGKHYGYIRQIDSSKIIAQLRYLKIENILPEMMEIAFIPQTKNGQFPGLFIFTTQARLMRPVKNLVHNKIEYIGSLEQLYMDIAVCIEEAYPDFTTHVELSKIDFMSHEANLVPLPDNNQSPRNMYQCQMSKQTMGTSRTNWPFNAENKSYRLLKGDAPLFRPVHYDNLLLDNFPMGTNAFVAVISNTGYDMEDAMIISKTSHERGFANGCIYKIKFLELSGSNYFARSPHIPQLKTYLDNDGLPDTGTKLSKGCPFYCYFDTEESTYKVVKMLEPEDCVVDSVRFCGNYNPGAARLASVTLRIPRQAIIGDKFASRAGQKGILSKLYPLEDMPFTESGMTPDIIFNPHGFPSRMTIAMMIEILAGKIGAMFGCVLDATAFQFSEDTPAVDYFGALLEAAGCCRYGTECMYSGTDGRLMQVDIFCGIVYYQRLRHMVSDKWQVRSTGPVDAVTQQPVKGRQRGGGVRFGEMERDALIAHGTAFLLQDRLFHNSDKTYVLLCTECMTILSPLSEIWKRNAAGQVISSPKRCLLCQKTSTVEYIEIPHSFKYLITELSSLNINVRIKTKKI